MSAVNTIIIIGHDLYSDTVVELRGRGESPGPLKERPGGPQNIWFERVKAYKGACKRPHEITHQSIIATYHSKHRR